MTFSEKLTNWYDSLSVTLLSERNLFDYPTTAPPVTRTKVNILQPILNVNTAAYADIQHFLTKLYVQIHNTGSHLAIVYADEQLVALMWELICASPDNYMWMMPFPGEF